MLKAQGIRKSFSGLEILKGVDIDVPEGKCVCIIGPSGSGKSTFLRCLNRLEEPDAGQVWLAGKEVTAKGANVNHVRQQIGMVFQSFNLYPHLTALNNVSIALRKVQKVPKQEARELARKALANVGLEAKADAYPGTLSGGQQQRVAIARAVALRPKVVLFDEPTSALDPELVGSVIDAMRDLRAEGMTMVVVTHELRFARQTADVVVFMSDGVEVSKGPPSAFFDQQTNPRVADFLRQVG